MRVRIKEKGFLGNKRIECNGMIDNVEINGDIMEPGRREVSIFFRGTKSSGIINFNVDEFNDLMRRVKPGLDIVKKVKKIR